MKIDEVREGRRARIQLEGRLDREWAEYLSDTLEEFLQEGVRSLQIDFAGVTYISSAATKILARWHQDLAFLRGDMRLTSLSPAVRETFAASGWDPAEAPGGSGAVTGGLRHSYWHSRTDFATSGQYELSAGASDATLTCRLHGDPTRLAEAPFGPGDCGTVSLPDGTFGLGLGALGDAYKACSDRFGELLAVAGCAAYFPSDGARMADYVVGDGGIAPRAVLACGLTCEGAFSHLLRFSTQAEAEAIPLSELATVALEAAGGKTAGLVVAAETAGLAGVRLRRSPGQGTGPVRFEVPAVREWLSFAPERTHAMTTTVIAGVVARAPEERLAAHLRPLGGVRPLHGHLHAMVFSYHPVPQRTVELRALVRDLFANHQLRDVLHLIWDDRGEAGVGESALLRGVAWIAPIAKVC